MRALLLLLVLLVPLNANAEKLKVVTSFSILADFTRQIGGEQIELHNLVGADEDAHLYEPSPDDARTLLAADLIVENGLGFEPWLQRLLASSEARGRLLTASRGVLPLVLEEDGESVADPHAWQSLANAEIYVRNIAAALAEADPDRADLYAARRDAYLAQIHALLEEANAGFARLPLAKRKVITSHDAFGYLGQAYRIRFLAPQGLSTEHEPSAAEIAALIRQIRSEGVQALFVENIRDPRMMRQIAEEAGARIGGTLYSDALAAEGPASSYLGMFRHNLDSLLAALD